MATLCNLCGKKIGFFEEFVWLDSETILCGECKAFHKKVEGSMDDKATFEAKIEEFKKRFPEEKHRHFLEHWNNTYNERSKTLEKDQREQEEQLKEENEIASQYSVNDNIGPFENEDISSTELNNNAEELRVTSDSIGMFGNIGGKIKTLAQVVTWIGIIGSVICGFVLMGIDEDLIFTGFIIALLGSLSSWVSSFVLYGFGQLIENTDKLVELAKNKKSD